MNKLPALSFCLALIAWPTTSLAGGRLDANFPPLAAQCSLNAPLMCAPPSSDPVRAPKLMCDACEQFDVSVMADRASPLAETLQQVLGRALDRVKEIGSLLTIWSDS